MKFSILGADGTQLCQIPALREACIKNGHLPNLRPDDENSSFVFVGNAPFTSYLDIAKQKKTIFNVLDLCPHCVEHPQIVETLSRDLKYASKVTTISKTVATELKQLCNIDAEVIYYPMKPVEFGKYTRKYPFKVMLVGRLGDANKRAGAAISALIKAGYEEHEVAIVGPEYLGYGVKLGVVSDEMLNDLYNSVDFVMMTSKNEGIGLPAIEAATAGAIPIVLPDLSTFQEFWINSPLGNLYQKLYNIDKISQLMIYINNNPEFKQTIKNDMAAYALLNFKPKFDANQVVKRLIDVYHTIQ